MLPPKYVATESQTNNLSEALGSFERRIAKLKDEKREVVMKNSAGPTFQKLSPRQKILSCLMGISSYFATAKIGKGE